MSDTANSGSQTEPNFVKAFIPGLMLGLVVGLLVGAFVPPLFETAPAIEPGVAPKGNAPSATRDILPPGAVDPALDDETDETPDGN